MSNPRPQMTGRGNQSTNSGKAGAGAGGVTGSLERSHAPLMSERSLNWLVLVLHLPYRPRAYWLLLARADRLRPGRRVHAILFELAGEPWWFVGKDLGDGCYAIIRRAS